MLADMWYTHHFTDWPKDKLAQYNETFGHAMVWAARSSSAVVTKLMYESEANTIKLRLSCD